MIVVKELSEDLVLELHYDEDEPNTHCFAVCDEISGECAWFTPREMDALFEAVSQLRGKLAEVKKE